MYGGMIAGAIIPIVTVAWGAYHYGVPATREIFAPGSDDPPYANIERVENLNVPGMETMLETLVRQSEDAARRDRDKEIRDLTESFLTNCRRIDDAMANGDEPRDYRAAIATAQYGIRYDRPACDLVGL